MRILAIDDDPIIRKSLDAGFSGDGHEVVTSASAEDALTQLENGTFDLLVVDIGLPGMSGLDLLSQIRASGRDVPVFFLTAMREESDIVEGLNLGADGYIPKPFSFAELRARVKAVLRRQEMTRGNLLRYADMEIDRLNRTVKRGGETLNLTDVEQKILLTLVEARGDSVSRDTMLKKVWGITFDPGTATLDVHLSNLRKKLQGAGPTLIETVRGAGWRIPPSED